MRTAAFVLAFYAISSLNKNLKYNEDGSMDVLLILNGFDHLYLPL